MRDEVSGSFESAVARFHLHPDVIVLGNSIMLSGGLKVSFEVEGGEVHLAHSTWHPEFGRSIPSHCLELHFRKSEASFMLIWN